MDMLRSIGKQSGESVESVHEICVIYYNFRHTFVPYAVKCIFESNCVKKAMLC